MPSAHRALMEAYERINELEAEIEVEAKTVNWLADELARSLGQHVWPAHDLETLRRQCNAYNARQASHV